MILILNQAITKQTSVRGRLTVSRVPYVTHPAPDFQTAWAWAGREWSPYYVTCDEERVTLQMECKGDKITSVFHPVKRECVEFDNKIIIG
ncbi:hypothetical protein DPMN_169859 [Dreissena polymorpha]|uniref:Uncharacterized protein n=1 Tax=Dreissena polymorpha TaxID=45954 RepID=A0A9D4DVC8_DREPO|nr:hypothetical protein DPMN_169856 [Dreissena polymorpha]KAH3768639.1 hypothetical protein DPMN_169859 [Dreissena polymorpha]